MNDDGLTKFLERTARWVMMAYAIGLVAGFAWNSLA